MFWFRRHPSYPGQEKTVFGLDFSGPLGLGNAFEGGSFTELSGDVHQIITRIRNKRPANLIAANLSASSSSTDEEKLLKEFSTSFSLLYDFADFFIVNTSVQQLSGGASSLEDISFLSEILDEILSLRLLNDKFKPVLVQVSPVISREQLNAILDYARYSGIDGIVVNDAETLSHIIEYTSGRLSVVVRTADLRPEHAGNLLLGGASLIELLPPTAYSGRKAVSKTLEYLYASGNHLYHR